MHRRNWLHALTVAAAITAAGAVASTAAAQGTPAPQGQKGARTHHATPSQKPAGDDQAALRAEAKITEDAARATALAQVKNGTVQSSELEREHGKLIYSFDIKVAGRPGIEEVNVDAITGQVVARAHESPKTERREARQEAREKHRGTTHKP